MFVNAKHAVEEGRKVIIIKANDTDVLVIAVNVLPVLKEIGVTQLWVDFGQGLNRRWIPVQNIMSLNWSAEDPRNSFFTHSLAVTFFPPSVVKGRKLLGKPGTYI